MEIDTQGETIMTFDSVSAEKMLKVRDMIQGMIDILYEDEPYSLLVTTVRKDGEHDHGNFNSLLANKDGTSHHHSI